jgi:AAA15 family ATPase/GTPase
MDISFSGTYRSLDSFIVEGLPKFCIITGLNGTGKTQFLELVQSLINPYVSINGSISISGESLKIDEALILTSEWAKLSNLTEVSFETVRQQLENFWIRFQQFAHDPSESTYLAPLFQKLSADIGKQSAEITQEEFNQNFDLAAPVAQTEVFNQTVGQAFMDFRIRQMEAEGKSLDFEPPWVLLREIISEAQLPFTFTDPSEISIRSSYTFTLTNTRFDKQIQFSELSSGEKVLMSLVFWLFHVRRTKVFPRLLLLDEPDAHLHPEMCKQFLDVVHEVFVKKHDVHVIMTTHNPVTVALADRNSLYEMFHSGERIQKTRSKSDTIRRLTAGLVNVSEAKSIVIVEDEDDQKFFQVLFDELIVDVKEPTVTIRNGERLVFVQASRPRHDRKTGDTTGGRCEVEKWVPKLRKAGLDLIVGLVDWDNKDDSGESIHLLPRYSFENYIVDPIVVFARLISEGRDLDIEGIPIINKNRSHTISSWSEEHLQNVANVINNRIYEQLKKVELEKVESKKVELEEMELEKFPVHFSNGIKLLYPRWLIQYRGKDLLSANIKEFDGRFVNQAKLTDSFQQLMLIPQEIITMFEKIQS